MLRISTYGIGFLKVDLPQPAIASEQEGSPSAAHTKACLHGLGRETNTPVFAAHVTCVPGAPPHIVMHKVHILDIRPAVRP